ncbi:hypothetical protein ACXR2U_05230 [Jatrophihabitans sp. YIM 134969]
MALTPAAAVPLAARALVPVGAALVLVAAGAAEAGPTVVLLLGVVLAVVRPARAGVWLAVPAAVWAFIAATPDDVGDGRVLLAAAGIYLLHTGTAAAAALPVTARVGTDVVRRWLRRCLPAVALTAVVALVDLTLGDTPDNPLFLTLAGLVAMVAVGVLIRLLAATREP